MCSIEMEFLTDDVNKSFEDDMDEDQLAYVPRPLGPSQGQQVGVPRGRASGLQAGGVKRAAATRNSREGYYTEEFQQGGGGGHGYDEREQVAVEQIGEKLLTNLANLVATITDGAKNQMEEGNVRKKKKVGLDDMVEEEEVTPVVFEGLDGMDDAVNKICWEIRTKLRPFTGDWDKFWEKQPRVSHPVRESLDASFLRMDPVNGLVTMRDHDRGAPRKIKQYLKDNLRVTKTKAWVSNQGMEEHDIGLARNYVEPTGVYEVISAIYQYAINVWMIRRDDWSGLLMLKVLHDCKFFAPILISKIRTKAERDKKQLEVITWFADHVLELNSQRGRLQKSPLMYDDVRKIATSAANRIYSGSGVALGWEMDMGACSFDPYTTAVEAGQEGLDGRRGGGGGYGRGHWRGGRGRIGGGRGGYQGVAGSQGGQHQQLSGAPAGGSGQLGGVGNQNVAQGFSSSRPCFDFNKGSCQYQNCKFAHKCNKVACIWNHDVFGAVYTMYYRRWCLVEVFVARTTQRRTIRWLELDYRIQLKMDVSMAAIFIWKYTSAVDFIGVHILSRVLLEYISRSCR